MRVIGLDWAVSPCDRAAIVMERATNGQIRVTSCVSPVEDSTAIEFCTSADHNVVAVDIPFSWPLEFTQFVSKWKVSSDDSPTPPSSVNFRYRSTDRFVHSKTNKWPLSVSTNLFALGARQWALIVHENELHRKIDVVGNFSADVDAPRIIEVYPGATLRAFENTHLLNISGSAKRIVEAGESVSEKTFSYKSDEVVRRSLVNAIVRGFNIDIEDSLVDTVVSVGRKDHATDALLAALTAIIYGGGVVGWNVWNPGDDQIERAKEEGWIFFPRREEPSGESPIFD